jgi:hypothetical protein
MPSSNWITAPAFGGQEEKIKVHWQTRFVNCIVLYCKSDHAPLSPSLHAAAAADLQQ